MLSPAQRPTKVLEIYREIFRRLEPLHVRAVIAGGAVVDFDHACDIDVFVLERGYKKPLDVLKALGGSLTVSQVEERPYEGGHADEFYRAGVAHPDWSPKPIHVTGFNDRDSVRKGVLGLLETFDLSIHAWALDDRLKLHRCDGTTTPREPIRVNHIRSTTPARLLKLSKRYHPAIHFPDGH